MGGFFGGGSSSAGGGGKSRGVTDPSLPGTQAAFGTTGLSREFSAENPVRMPVYNSPAQLEAARLKMAGITARSGRTSTQLVNAPGTGTYGASFLGSLPGAAQ